MIPVEKLLFDIDQKVNRLANLRGQYIPDETKIEVLNIAQTKLVLKKLGLNNNYQLGMDSFTKRYQDLQGFMIPYEKLTVTKTVDDLNNSYHVAMAALSKNMIVPIEAYITADKGNCKGHQLDVINIVKHNNLRLFLNSPHSSPNFRYQETLASISSGLIYVYSDSDNSFTINNLYLSYLRYPVDMDIAGYVHLDNTISATVDCELEAYLENELVELAVEEIADATANNELSQTSRTRTKEAE